MVASTQLLECLNKVNIFNSLSSDELEDISHYVSHDHFRAGELVYQNEESAHNFYIVERGRLRNFKLSENGKLQTLRYVKSGEFAGDLAYFRNLDVYEANADAIIDTKVCKISYVNLDKIVKQYPAIQHEMLNTLATRLSELENLTLSITTQTATQRLMTFLINRSDIDSEGKRIVKSTMSRKDAASFLGITPETMSRLLTNLEKDNRIIVHKNYFELL